MVDFTQLLLTFIISSLNLATCFIGLKRGFKQKSITILFWLSVIYISSIPLFVDSFACLAGMRLAWESILNKNEINYYFELSNQVLLNTALFAFAFNLIFLAVYETTVKKEKQTNLPNIAPVNHCIPKIAINICAISGWLGLLLYYFSAIQAIYSPLLAIASAGLYYCLIDKKYVMGAICSFPSVLLAFFLTERPYIVPLISIVLMFYLTNTKVFKLKEKLLTILMCLIVILLFTSVRVGRGHLTYFDILMSTAYPISRDFATNTMYYTFDVAPTLQEYGEFNGLKFLLGTGILPEAIFGERVFASADLPHILALHRFSWDYGTIHPSIYGWAFIDMGWQGVFFGAFVGLLIGLCHRWAKGYFLREGIVYSTLSIFIIVAVRGSIQVGYARMVYGLALGALFCWFIHFGQTRLRRSTLTVPTK